MRQLLTLALVCLAGAFGAAACSSSSSGHGTTTVDSGSGGGPEASAEGGGSCPAVGSGAGQYTTGNATCDACLAQNCCATTTACVNNTPCLDALNCTVACVKADGGTTAACGLTCIGENDGSGADALMLSQCQSNSCATQC